MPQALIVINWCIQPLMEIQNLTAEEWRWIFSLLKKVYIYAERLAEAPLDLSLWMLDLHRLSFHIINHSRHYYVNVCWSFFLWLGAIKIELHHGPRDFWSEFPRGGSKRRRNDGTA